MPEPKDIDRAKKIFKEWDNLSKWKKPSEAFIEHTKTKAEGTLNLAIYLNQKISENTELLENKTTPLWIITQSYYSMFFLTEYLLAKDMCRQIPEDTDDTHKTIYLALLYYYLVKESEFEKNSKAIPTTSKISKALVLFKEVQDETLEIARITRNIDNLNKQREQRNKLTYRMNKSAEEKEAKSALDKAIEYRNLIYEYLKTKR